ncbi:MAG: hypothetical protein RR547_04970 [Raoultibacter sp.]
MRKIIAVGAALALCLVLGACSGASNGDQAAGEQEKQEQVATIDYTVSDDKLEYARGDQTGMAYRVSVAESATNDDLKAVFEKVVADDGFDMHEVWFYSDTRLTDGSAAYDVALASKSSAEGEVTITMASDESKQAAKALLADKNEAEKSGTTEGASANASPDAGSQAQ